MTNRVYRADPDGDGQWISLSGENKTYFNTESEARIMADKVKFTEKAQEFCNTLAELFKDAPDLAGVYFDEGFNSVGSDPIIDADVVGLGITAADVTAFVTVAQQLQKFDIGDGGDPVITDNYGASVNRMRTDV